MIPNRGEAKNGDRHLMARVAWLYFVEEMTQGDIADHLGVTRYKVNRTLAEGRRSGLVQINIDSELVECLALEKTIKQTFGVREALIVPSPKKSSWTHTVVGAALGQYLSKAIENGDNTTFGFGWGQTLREAIRFVRPKLRPEATIVTLLGALPHCAEENSFEIIARFGALVAGERYYLTAPIYTNSRTSRESLEQQDFFKETAALIREVDVGCFAVGNMSSSSLLIRDGLPTSVRAEDITTAGAVGDLLGNFIDINGRLVDHPINDQLVGLRLHELRSIKTLVMASGGRGKVNCITGALRTGLIDVFISDERTAAAVLRRHKRGAIQGERRAT